MFYSDNGTISWRKRRKIGVHQVEAVDDERSRPTQVRRVLNLPLITTFYHQLWPRFGKPADYVRNRYVSAAKLDSPGPRDTDCVNYFALSSVTLCPHRFVIWFLFSLLPIKLI